MGWSAETFRRVKTRVKTGRVKTGQVRLWGCLLGGPRAGKTSITDF